MECPNLVFSGHALRQMFTRQISGQDVRHVVATGTAVTEYPHDQPYPSRLLLGFVDGRPIHVVLAYDETSETGYVVTAYQPDPDLWNDDFTTRK